MEKEHDRDLEIQLPEDWLTQHCVNEGDTVVLTKEKGRVLVQTEKQHSKSPGYRKN